MDEIRQADGASASGPEFREIKSKYEFVMAAAKEAERINDIHRRNHVSPDEKVTIDALRRIRKGLSRVSYDEPRDTTEEPPKETTYFFGS